jgi:ParB family chromosome partitioning protein
VAERKRRGLGRGLSSLLGEEHEREASVGLIELPLDRIAPNPDQPRVSVEPEALAALAESISSSGLVQPVVVQPADREGIHELIAGERRWRAAREAGLERIPAIIRRADDRDRLELALVENLVREDLNPIEVANACATLVEDFDRSHTELASSLGRSRPSISNLMRLLELPEDVQELVAEGRLSEGAARAVLQADGAKARRALAERIVAEGLSVREAESLGRVEEKRSRRRNSRPVPQAADDAASSFMDVFETPVRVRRAGKEGLVLELRFENEAALEAAVARLETGAPTEPTGA